MDNKAGNLSQSDFDYDIAIIGGGVTGSLTAYNLSMFDIKVCVIEKESDLASGATGANSGIVHAGYDPKPGSMKAIYNIKGSKIMPELCRKLSVPFKNNGSLVLAFTPEEHHSLIELFSRGVENGVEQIHILDKTRVRNIEPNISEKVYSALYLPSGSIVCPYELTFASAEAAASNGVDFFFEHPVTNIKTPKETGQGFFEISCKTNSSNQEIKIITAKYIVNASGVCSDRISQMVGDFSHRIIPRKGEYITLDKELEGFIKATIFQAPTQKGKGVLVTPTVDGNILIGPNSVEIKDPFDISTTEKGIEEVKKQGQRAVPELDFSKAIRSFAGIRATSDYGDFIIGRSRYISGFYQCAGIESPGLTAAPAIALKIKDEILFDMKYKVELKKNFSEYRASPVKFRELSYEQRDKLIKKDFRYANILCRCENVTEAEVIDSIHRFPGAKDINGVKMRTRAGMGRCQGGFCLPKIVPVIARELNIPPEQVTLSGKGSKILKGTKRGN